MKIENEDKDNEIEKNKEIEEFEEIKECYNPLFENLGFCTMSIKKGRKIPKTTQGQEKLLNQLYEIIRKDSFNIKIIKLRNKYKIPERGYRGYEKHDIWGTTIVDNGFYCPEEWSGEKGKQEMDNVDQDIVKLCQKYGVPSEIGFDWFNIFKTYIFYNLIIPTVTFDLCRVVKYYSEEYDPDAYREWRKVHEKNFPVGIMVSPYASQRDIVDFVKKNYSSLIEPIQKQYRQREVAIGKTRRRNADIQARNNFIYENYEKGLSIKELANLSGQFGEDLRLDEGSVGKVISLEKKRREV